MKNDMKPSLNPFFFVKRILRFFSQIPELAVMSHSLNVVRMAAVCCAMTSWAAILRAERRHFSAGKALVLGCVFLDPFSGEAAGFPGTVAAPPTDFAVDGAEYIGFR